MKDHQMSYDNTENAQMVPMTDSQRELARHALGLTRGRASTYRNRFVGSPNHPEWLAMVAAGMAVQRSGKREDGTNIFAGGADLFVLTRRGAEAALRPGETLDPEDFPTPTGATR